MKNLSQLFIATAIACMVTSCSDNDNNGTPVVDTVTGAYLSNGVCYDANNSTLANTECANLNYQISGTQCVDRNTNQTVTLNNCTTNTYFFSGSSCYQQTTNQNPTVVCKLLSFWPKVAARRKEHTSEVRCRELPPRRCGQACSAGMSLPLPSGAGRRFAESAWLPTA